MLANAACVDGLVFFSIVDAEPGIVDWAFSLNFPFFLVRKVKDLGNNTSQRAFSRAKKWIGGSVAPALVHWPSP